MSLPAISVENLSKVYDIRGVGRARRETLIEQLSALFSAPMRAVLQSQKSLQGEGTRKSAESEYWALRDISFEIPEGQSVGIIGHNGAGKSTLLKILSRITHPSSGQARVRGRMASLLEVGTGFHPDLSGRDNVLFNGAILGLSRREIASRFDAIVDFSGVENYIDTPIKHYSSGMKVRLAFAVAAHLEPDILVIDEVLAVGDAAFQKKCLSRIEEVGSSGRTVLFVSHQLTTVARLCQYGIVLDHGRKVFDGRALDAIRYYNEHLGLSNSVRHWDSYELAPGDGVARLLHVELHHEQGIVSGPVDIGQTLEVEFHYSLRRAGSRLTPSIHVLDASNTWVFSAIDLEPRWHNQPRPAGDYRTRVQIPPHFLNEGTYTLGVGLATLEPFESHCFLHDCVGFTVVDPLTGDSARGSYQGEFPGVIRPKLPWSTEKC